MRRFWIKFDLSIDEDTPPGLLMGCGVTAEDISEAKFLIKKKVFNNKELPSIVDIIENVNISSLDAGHVISNMGNIFIKGIWFPKGYE